ncbi:MAG: hypothetical protein E7115_03800 [Bacteroidales bacterium]|nr:hypothetical protein [Bacteroidales bacterium]
MKKILTIATALVTFFALASCGGGNKQKEAELTEKALTLTETNFDSNDYELANYISIVDNEYALKKNADTLSLELKIKLTKENPEFKGLSIDQILLEDSYTVAVFLTDGTESITSMFIEDNDQVNAIKTLLQGNVGDELNLKFTEITPDAKQIIKKATSIEPYRVSQYIDLDTPEARRAKHPGYVLVENVKLPKSISGSVELVANEDGYFPIYLDEYNYPSIDFTFKLLKSVNTAPLSSAYGQMWLNGVPQKSNGANVKDLIPSYDEWRSDDSDGRQFKNFLEGEVGETITMTFTGENNIELFETDQSKINAGVAKTKAACKEVAKFQFFIVSY